MSLNPNQFQQLPMFMTPREIVETHFMSDADNGKYEGDTAALMLDKARKTGRNGFKKMIAEEGIQEPLGITHGYYEMEQPTLTDGHHRVAATMGTPRYDQLAPVIHNEHGDQEIWNMHRRLAGVQPFNYKKSP